MNIRYTLRTHLWNLETIKKYMGNYKIWKHSWTIVWADYWEQHRPDYIRRPNAEFFLAMTTIYSMDIVDYECTRTFRTSQTERGKFFL